MCDELPIFALQPVFERTCIRRDLLMRDKGFENLLRYYLLFASANLVMCLRAGRKREFCVTMG